MMAISDWTQNSWPWLLMGGAGLGLFLVRSLKQKQTKKFRQTSQRYSAPPDSKDERDIDKSSDGHGERDMDAKSNGERKEPEPEPDEEDAPHALRTVKTHKQVPHHLRETNESPPTSQQAAWTAAYVTQTNTLTKRTSKKKER